MKTTNWLLLSSYCLVLRPGVGAVFAKEPEAPIEITAFASGPSEVMSLLYLETRHPDRFKVNFNYFARFDEKAGKFLRPDSEAGLNENLKVLYVRLRYPGKFYDYAQCLQYDPPGGTCGPLLGLDLSKFDPKDPALLAALKESAAEAQRLKLEDTATAVFVNGNPYRHTLYLTELLANLNALLPKERRVAAVKLAEAAPAIKLYALGSAGGAGTRDKEWESRLLRGFPNLDIVSLDPSSKEGKRFMKKTAIAALPTYFFDKNIEKHPAVLNGLLERRLAGKMSGYYVVSRNGGSRVLLNRPVVPKTLTLFVMSQCPYGVQAENDILKAMKDKTIPADVKLNVKFIVSPGSEKEGEWNSLHGPAETAEDIRQIVIQKYLPEKFPAYLEARNPDYRSEKWEEAAQKAGIDPQFVKDRFQDGSKLLEEDYKETAALGINASPTYLWENRNLLASKSDLQYFLGDKALGEAGKSAMAGSAPGASCQ